MTERETRLINQVFSATQHEYSIYVEGGKIDAEFFSVYIKKKKVPKLIVLIISTF